jgi:hypothetical protein
VISRQAKRDRRKQRGAALVEAAIVLPVLIGFLTVMVMLRAVFVEKIDGATKTRSDVLSFAGNGCEGKFGTATRVPVLAGGLPGSSFTDKHTKKAAGSSAGTREATSGILQKAMAKIDEREVASKNGPKWRGKVGGHASFLLCNEKAHGSGISGLAGWITSTVAGFLVGM